MGRRVWAPPTEALCPLVTSFLSTLLKPIPDEAGRSHQEVRPTVGCFSEAALPESSRPTHHSSPKPWPLQGPPQGHPNSCAAINTPPSRAASWPQTPFPTPQELCPPLPLGSPPTSTQWSIRSVPGQGLHSHGPGVTRTWRWAGHSASTRPCQRDNAWMEDICLGEKHSLLGVPWAPPL